MLLREMFSPLGGANDDSAEIDWPNDLKFFIDNNDEILELYMFPAIRKHQKHVGNPNAFKLYLNPIQQCKNKYVEKYNIEDPDQKITKDSIVKLARQIAKEQEAHIKNKSYED
jgi:hypothetical protein